MTNNRTAILLGAGGLTGGYCLQYLLGSDSYDRVKIIVRKSLNIQHPKLETIIVNFDKPETYTDHLSGSDIFCCLGTTIRKAGSQEAFKKVDHDYPLQLAKIARQNGVNQFILMSSLGANAGSSNFYMKTKGELELALEKLEFNSLIIVRPSMLLGSRKEFRLGELIGQFFMLLFYPLFLGTFKKYRPIHAKKVAQKMVQLSLQNLHGTRITDWGTL